MAELGWTKRSNLLVCVGLSPVVYGDKQGIGCRDTLHFEIYIALAPMKIFSIVAVELSVIVTFSFIPCMSQAYAQQLDAPDSSAFDGVRVHRWSVLDRPESGKDLMKVCLIHRDGHWVEGDLSQPDNCDEMLVAVVDSHEIWPDDAFYSSRIKAGAWGEHFLKSKFFKVGTNVSVRWISDDSAVLGALYESGAGKRLDDQYAARANTCSSQYALAKTKSVLDEIANSCGGYADSRGAEKRFRDNEESERQKKMDAIATKSRPKCSVVRFSGIVAGNGSDLSALSKASNIEDIIANHPLHCGPSGFTQTYVCGGAALLLGNIGYIVSWPDNAYQVATSIDLQGGRKDTLIFINRSDATCLDQTPPSLSAETNLDNFLKHHNTHR